MQIFGKKITIKSNPILDITDKESDWYNNDYELIRKQLDKCSEFKLLKSHPCLSDRDTNCGIVEFHYFYQDVYVARKIFESNPLRHVDIGSRINGFIAHLLVFRDVELFDVRPLNLSISGVTFTQIDITDETSIPKNYCDSISCLHALEHFGLGRYGDRIDSNGHLKGFENITKILKPGGKLYFSVPIGQQRIEFNAHRVFGVPYLLNMISDKYEILTFAYVDDNNILHENVNMSQEDINTSFNCRYGCAIFELKKKNDKDC